MMAMVISEVEPVIFMPKRTCNTRTPSVTMAIDSPIERTILSMTLTLLKKTNVQAKPGRKKTTTNPIIPRSTGNCWAKGTAKSRSSLKSTV